MENSISVELIDPDCGCGEKHRAMCLIPQGFSMLKPGQRGVKCRACGKGWSKLRSEMYMEVNSEWIVCFYCAWLNLTDEADTEIQDYDDDALKDMIKEIYCDGGLLKLNKYGGTWAWCAVDEHGKRLFFDSGVVEEPPSGKKVTNNHTEQIAIVKALEAMPDGWSGTLVSDSMIATGRVFYGYRIENLPRNIHDRGQVAKNRMGSISTRLLKGHPQEEHLRRGEKEKSDGNGVLPVSIHNVFCDMLCEEARDAWFTEKEIER